MNPLIFTLALFASVNCLLRFQYESPEDFADNAPPGKIFMNYIDHFNTIRGKYKQQFWEDERYFKVDKPRMILFVCGEGPCGPRADTTLMVVAAKQFNAKVIYLEHRYYGGSQPMKDWSVESLKYLTHDQALADIAYFIESKNKEYQETTKKTLVPKWILISGSYPGALVAWFRYKFPHLAIGAIASSAVVNPIADFSDYEEQMISDLNITHADQLRRYERYADTQMLSPDKEAKKKFLKIFGMDKDVDMLEFAYYFADLPVGYIQGSRRKTLLAILDKLRKENKPVEEQIRDLVNESKGHLLEYYLFSHLGNITADPNKYDRQWSYQACSAFGFFQSPSEKNPIRWVGMNITYWRKWCNGIFGKSTIFPDIGHQRVLWGGMNIAKTSSQIYFTQGVEDGWKWAGMRNDTKAENKEIEVNEIVCEECAHCIDLKGAKDTDPPVLKAAREDEIKKMKAWFGEQ